MRIPPIVCTVLLVGCTPVGPEFQRPEVPLNPAWLDAELEQYDSDPAKLLDWWRNFNDPVLDELIRTAQRENNNLEIAGLRVLEAQASLNIARGAQYPQGQVVIGETAAVGASENDANTAAGDLSFTQFTLGASIAWELDFWGRFRRGIEAADAALLASIASYDEAMLLLTAAVAETYAIIRATEEQLRLARESVALQRRSYEIVEVLFRNGHSSELDALQARTLLLGTEASIPALESDLQQAKNALSVLLGKVPADIDDILIGEGQVPRLPPSLSVGVPADLLRQRPDVRRAELQALAQNALVGVAQADLYPSFSINGFLGVSAADGTNTTRTGHSGIDELFSADSLTYSVGPTFVWPFLNYGRIRNNIRVNDARLQQALVAYRETVIQAAREVEDAMAQQRGARAVDRILFESVAVAERSAELSFLRYQEGFADYQRVLQAQQSLFSQQQRYASNRGALALSMINLFRSLGGGWQSTAPRQYTDQETRREMQERTDWGDLLERPPSN